jgi:hypothetical protein
VIRIQEVLPRCPEFDINCLRAILKQIGSRDEREHAAILQIVEGYCSPVRMPPLTPLFSALAAELQEWEMSPNYMFAILGVLSIVTAVIRNLPGSLKFAAPLIDHCLTLLTVPSFLFFRHAFFGLVTAVGAIDPRFSERVLDAAIRFWPRSASLKQAAFIRLFGIALPRLSPHQANALMPKVLSTLAGAICVPSTRVSEAALILILERTLDSFIAVNARAAMCALYAPLHSAMADHWSAEVRDLAEKAGLKLSKSDPKLWGDLATLGRRENKAAHGWARIAHVALWNGHTIAKVGEIAKAFEKETADGGPKSRVKTGTSMHAVQLPSLGHRTPCSSPVPWARTTSPG